MYRLPVRISGCKFDRHARAYLQRWQRLTLLLLGVSLFATLRSACAAEQVFANADQCGSEPDAGKITLPRTGTYTVTV